MYIKHITLIKSRNSAETSNIWLLKFFTLLGVNKCLVEGDAIPETNKDQNSDFLLMPGPPKEDEKGKEVNGTLEKAFKY